MLPCSILINRCDLEKFSSFFTEDVEFYHDQGGVTPGKEKLTDSIRRISAAKLPGNWFQGRCRSIT
jgi:hypothetical protein